MKNKTLKEEREIKSKIFWVMQEGEDWSFSPIVDEEGYVNPECIPAIAIDDLVTIFPELDIQKILQEENNYSNPKYNN